MSRKIKRLFWVVILFLVLMGGALVGLRGAGRWLVREDVLSSADVILILSGNMPYRAEEAAKIFHHGYAAEIWITRPESPEIELEKLGIRFVGEEEYNREILVQQLVPEGSIHILTGTTVDTEQEVEEAAKEMRRHGKTKIIIVTSPEHTRRVKQLWRKLVGENPMAIIRAAPEDPFDADHWWRNTRDGLAVAREILGLLNVWSGLPVRPHST